MRTSFVFAALLAGAGISACSSAHTVRLSGQFSRAAPPPEELRVMLDPHLGHAASREQDAEKPITASDYRSVYPNERGLFTSPDFEVEKSRWREMRPTFFLGFVNEQDVIYAVGERDAVVQYRAYDAATKAPLDRAEVCWKIRSASFEAKRRSVVLNLLIGPNFDSRKTCLPPGEYAPEEVVTPDEESE